MNISRMFDIHLTVGQPYVTMSMLPNVLVRGRNEQYRNGETYRATRLDNTPSPTSKRAYLYLRRQETGFENQGSVHCSREQDRPAHTCADPRKVTHVASTEAQNVESLKPESLPDTSDNRPRFSVQPFQVVLTTFVCIVLTCGNACQEIRTSGECVVS